MPIFGQDCVPNLPQIVHMFTTNYERKLDKRPKLNIFDCAHFRAITTRVWLESREGLQWPVHRVQVAICLL